MYVCVRPSILGRGGGGGGGGVTTHSVVLKKS